MSSMNRGRSYRVGQIVPSSNTTMETEIPAIPKIESRVGIPVLSSAVGTAFRLLEELGLETKVPDAGALLNGTYSTAACRMRQAVGA